MSTLHAIADFVSEIELSDKDAEGLRDRMQAFRQGKPALFNQLMRAWAFRALWEALDECWNNSLRIPTADDEYAWASEQARIAERRAGWDPNP
jgi:hypothetical protein